MCKKMFILIVVLGLAGAAPATITEVNDTQTWITFDMTGGDWLVIGPDGDLTVTGESRVAFGPEGNPSKVIVNGGTLTLNNRLNTDGWAAIEMNGGYFRIGLGPEGSLKFPDNGGPVWIYLNDGVLSVHDCQNFVDRGSLIVVGYGVMQLDSTSCSQCNPNDWLSQGGIVPAEGFGAIQIQSVGGKTEISATTIPKITFASASSGDVETVSPAEITVNVVDGKTETYTVQYSVAGGTATAGTDYTLTSGTLTFEAGQTSKTISINIIDDGVPEDDETIILSLSNPSGGGAVLGGIKQHTYTIIDPRPTVQFDSNSSTGMEDESPAEISVSLSAAVLTQVVRVDYAATGGTATGGGVDYAVVPGTLMFYPGETTKTVSVELTDDGEKELPETVILTLSNPSPSDVLRLGSQSQHTITLRDPWATIAYEVFKVDLGCPGNPATLKEGWIPFEGAGWCDGQRHDGRGISDISGTGIDAYIDDVKRGGSVNLVSTSGDPIANTAFQVISGVTGHPGASIELVLSGAGLVAGEYWLYTYHNWGGLFNMPALTAAGSGVVQVEEVTDVPIQSVGSDAELVPSLVKFYTDGSGPVTITYQAGQDSRAVVNAFELHSTETPFIASNPAPDDGAQDVLPDVILTWAAGAAATSHDVYMGTDFDAVNNAADPDVLPGRGNQTETSYTPGILAFGQTYYWRIDEVNEPSTWEGEIWTFTTDSGKARDPAPADDGRLLLGDFLSWTAGALATSHDVYFGGDFGAVSDATVSSTEYKGNQIHTTYNPGTLEEATTYYWRIDERSHTIVEGDVWTFRTAGGIDLRVDLTLTEWGPSLEPRPKTAKPDWIHWTTNRWDDMYSHDCDTFTDIGGTGIEARITLLREGDGGLKVSGLEMCKLNGDCAPYGSPIHDPICNTWYQAIDWPDIPWASIQLALHGLPAGQYELTSYHNHFGCYRSGDTPDGTGVKCDCVCKVQPPMPSVRAMSVKEARYVPGQDPDPFSKLFPGINWDTGPFPEGVTAIETAYNVVIQQVTSDDDLVPSVIRFETDGSPVLVLYEAGCCQNDDVRPTRWGGRSILNAFELALIGPSCQCMGDVAATDGFSDPDGKVDTGDMAKLLSELITGGGTADDNYKVQSPSAQLLSCGDLAGTDGFSAPDDQIDTGDMAKLLSHLIVSGDPDNNYEAGCIELP